MRQRKGVTIIEILVSILIILILVSLIFGAGWNYYRIYSLPISTVKIVDKERHTDEDMWTTYYLYVAPEEGGKIWLSVNKSEYNSWHVGESGILNSGKLSRIGKLEQ